MIMFWGIVLIVVVGFLLFGFLLDRKTDRYKLMTDKKVKSDIESHKDEAQKQSYPTNINNTGPW